MSPETSVHTARTNARESWSNGPFEPRRLAELEARLQHRLPDSFRAFLQRYNGARFGLCDTGVVGGRGGSEPVQLDSLLGLPSTPGLLSLLDEDEDFPPGFLRFADALTFDSFVLQLDARDGVPAGAVWFFHAMSDEGGEGPYGDFLANRRLYAPSFDAFLDRLVVLEPMEEEPPAGTEEEGEGAPLEVVTFPKGQKPTLQRPLVLEGKARAVRKARFGISVQDEAWDETTQQWVSGPEHLSVRYWLSLEVNARSGEDGFAAPEATLPVFHAAGHRHPSLAQLARLEVGPEGPWEAWYGNDAPALDDNRLRFRGRKGERFRIRWEARYVERTRLLPFVFDGEVKFMGISLGVKTLEEADALLLRAFGGAHQPAKLRRKVGARVDGGESLPPERRFTLPVTYLPAASRKR